MAVQSKLHCAAVTLVDCEQLEQVAVRVVLPRRSLYIVAVYLPPNSNVGLYSSQAPVQNLSETSSNDDIVLLIGDYNLPHLRWCFEDDLNGLIPSNACSEKETNFTESILSCGLVQVNSHVNWKGR